MGMKVVGNKELIVKMKRMAKDAPVATGFGLYHGLQEIMLDAKERAPKDTTAMALSGYVTPPTIRSNGHVDIDAGFGGLSEEYVIRQHEDTTLNHPNGGQAKFFSNALDAGKALLARIVSAHVSEFLNTGRSHPVPKKVPATPWEDVPGGAVE